MRNVVFVGPRHRGFVAEVDNIKLIHTILVPRQAYYGAQLNVIAIGCDVRLGKDIKIFCEERGIKLTEHVVYFNGPRTQDEYKSAYNARHAALLDQGHEFHVAVSGSRRSDIEDLVTRLQANTKPYALYNESNEVVESHGWENSSQTEKAS